MAKACSLLVCSMSDEGKRVITFTRLIISSFHSCSSKLECLSLESLLSANLIFERSLACGAHSKGRLLDFLAYSPIIDPRNERKHLSLFFHGVSNEEKCDIDTW
jgi:hypothetical protein